MQADIYSNSKHAYDFEKRKEKSHRGGKEFQPYIHNLFVASLTGLFCRQHLEEGVGRGGGGIPTLYTEPIRRQLNRSVLSSTL